jgi:translation initiation factor 4G
VVNLEEIKRQIESQKDKENRLAEEQAKDGDGEESKTSEAMVKTNEDAAHRLMEKKKRRKAKKETARIERERKEAEERAAREEREKECLPQEEERVQREAGENTERERAEQEILRKLQEEEQAQTTINTNIAPPLPSALATARHIEDINRITYPDGIKRPKVELNVNNQKGKFRYVPRTYVILVLFYDHVSLLGMIAASYYSS